MIITLLRLPLDLTPESPAWKEDGSANLLTGVSDYIRRCKQKIHFVCMCPTYASLC